MSDTAGNTEKSSSTVKQPQLRFKLVPDEEQKQIPIDQIDEYGSYKLKLPLENFNSKGVKNVDVVQIQPWFDIHMYGQRINLASKIGEWREMYKWTWWYSAAITLFSGLMFFKKHKYTKYMAIPLSASWYYCWYLHSLAYGNMINRVNVQAVRILTEEKRKYFVGTLDPSIIEEAKKMK